LQGKGDPETDALLDRLKETEKYIDGRVATILKGHPAYSWFSRVKGVGKENIGKVVGMVDIERAGTISALWKFAGFSVENGKSPKRAKGEKLSYNSQLRSMCWRLATSLLKAKGKFYDYYCVQKDNYYERYTQQGIKVVATANLPKKNGKKVESEGFITEGHVHNQALRKMIKLFLSCLWLEWRQAEGLSMTLPYAIDKLGHDSLIQPEEMTDKPPKVRKPSKASEPL
jgi:hypothetical protein